MSQRRDRGWRGLYKGEYVAYHPSMADNGQVCAVEVTGVFGGPLMCEAAEDRKEKLASAAPQQPGPRRPLGATPSPPRRARSTKAGANVYPLPRRLTTAITRQALDGLGA